MSGGQFVLPLDLWILHSKLSFCPAGVYGVCQGAGERGGRGGLPQHNFPVAAAAPGRLRLGQPHRQHRAPALNSTREGAAR